jgi:hypothetical protein
MFFCDHCGGHCKAANITKLLPLVLTLGRDVDRLASSSPAIALWLGESESALGHSERERAVTNYQQSTLNLGTIFSRLSHRAAAMLLHRALPAAYQNSAHPFLLLHRCA